MNATDAMINSSQSDDLIPLYLRESISKIRTYWDQSDKGKKTRSLVEDNPYKSKTSVASNQLHSKEVVSTWENLALPAHVLQDIRSTISLGLNTVFEDGIHNEFYPSLDRIIRLYGVTVLDCLQETIASPLLNAEVSAEIMRYLGEMQHAPTYRLRLQMLIQALQHTSSKVRDGSSLGLASLDDPMVIPALRTAIKRERITGLRNDMQLVLEQLKEI